jgi:hypothetical protein
MKTTTKKRGPLVVLMIIAVLLMIIGPTRRFMKTPLSIPTRSQQQGGSSVSQGTTVISHSKWTGVHSIPEGRRIEWRQRSANIIYQTRIDYDDRLIFTHYPGRPDLELPETKKVMEWRIPDEEQAAAEIIDWKFVNPK